MIRQIAGHLLIKSDTRMVFNNHRSRWMRLSETEWSALMALAQGDSFVSSHELSLRVWGERIRTDAPAPDKLRKLIGRLRLQIGRDLIDTDRGWGYRLGGAQ